MFGYITLNKPEMKVKNLEAYPGDEGEEPGGVSGLLLRPVS